MSKIGRPRNPLRKKALKLWIESGRKLTPKEIGEKLEVSSALIRKWKHEDDWDEEPDKRPRGGQPGNRNALGNSGGAGGPVGNDKALKHGVYSKFLPQNPKFQELLSAVQDMDPMDMMWNNVEFSYAKLLWSQEIMFVDGREDHTELIKGRGDGYVDYEHHRANDKQATDISSYATISREFRAAVKQFLNTAPDNDERRLKLEHMQAQLNKTKAETDKINGVGKSDNSKDWADAVSEVATRRKAKGRES